MLFDALVAGNLRRDPLRLIMNVVAVAIGVGFAIATALAGAQLDRSIDGTIGAYGRRPALSVLAPGRGLDERVLGTIRYAPGVADANPMIERSALVRSNGRFEPVRMVGSDFLRPLPGLYATGERFPGPAQTRGQPFDQVRAIADGAIVVPFEIAQRLHASAGDRVSVFGDTMRRLPIAYVLPAGERGVDSSVVFTDVATAQMLFGQTGYFDRIDVLPSVEISNLQASLERRLPPYVRVVRDANDATPLTHLMSGIQSEVRALEVPAALAALSIVAATVGASLRARRRDIGIVRTLGATRPAVFAIFIQESAFIGACGAFAGIVLGEIVAPIVARVTVSFDPLLDVFAACAGILAACAATVVPALRAARARPLEAMSERAEDPVRVGLASFSSAATGRLRGTLGIAAVFAPSNVLRSPRRVALALLSFALSVGVTVSFALVGRSIESAVAQWANATFHADLTVVPDAGVPVPLPTPLYRAARNIPGVMRVERARSLTVAYRGSSLVLRGGDDVPEPRVTPAFARTQHVAAGDRVDVATPSGPLSLKIGSIETGFAATGLGIDVPFAVLARAFHDPRFDRLDVFVRPGHDPHAARVALLRAIGHARALVRSGGELRDDVFSLVETRFRAAQLLSELLLATAVVSAAVAFSTIILERRRELRILRSIGASRRLLRLSALLETSILAGAGSATGIAAGSLLAAARLDALGTTTFGAPLPLVLDLPLLVWIIVATIGAAAGAALLAARGMSRTLAAALIGALLLRQASPAMAFVRAGAAPANETPASQTWRLSTRAYDRAGRLFGVLFTVSERSVSTSLAIYSAAVSVVDARTGRVSTATRLERNTWGIARSARAATDVHVGDWSLRRTKAGSGAIVLNATDDKLRIALVATPQRRMIRLAPGADAITRLSARGVLHLNGTAYALNGLAWFDHESGPPPSDQWQRLDVQFRDGRDLAVRAFLENGVVVRSTYAVMLYPDGRVRRFDVDEIGGAAGGAPWRSDETGFAFPTHWIVAIPAADVDLAVEPLFREQELAPVPASRPLYAGLIDVERYDPPDSDHGHGFVEATGAL